MNTIKTILFKGLCLNNKLCFTKILNYLFKNILNLELFILKNTSPIFQIQKLLSFFDNYSITFILNFLRAIFLIKSTLFMNSIRIVSEKYQKSIIFIYL